MVEFFKYVIQNYSTQFYQVLNTHYSVPFNFLLWLPVQNIFYVMDKYMYVSFFLYLNIYVPAWVLNCVRLFVTSWTVAHKIPLCTVFSKDTGVSCHFFLQGIFPTQGSNLSLLLMRQILYHWATKEAERGLEEKKGFREARISMLTLTVFLFQITKGPQIQCQPH